MNVSVNVDLSVAPEPKHLKQMKSAALALTDDLESVQVTHPMDPPRRLRAHFSVPTARQEDVVDSIGPKFWQVEDYNDLSIGFSSAPRPRRRSSRPTR